MEKPRPLYVHFILKKKGGRQAGNCCGPNITPHIFTSTPASLPGQSDTNLHTVGLAVPFIRLPMASQQAYNLIVLFPLYFEEICF